MFLIDWPGGSWEATLRMTLMVLALYMAALWITLVFWTYRDVRQRSRDPIVQTFAVLLVLLLFLPGHWIYLILRPRYTLSELYERSLEEEALLQELEDQKACPTCKRRVHDEYLICPSCRTALKEACRNCSKPLQYAWVACPFCGAEKPARSQQRPAAPAAIQRSAPEPRSRTPRPAPAPVQQQTTVQTATPPPRRRPPGEDSGGSSVIDATAD
jgi:RNA polymerase subunit RPABC4/transcription elongation factor Spt4